MSLAGGRVPRKTAGNRLSGLLEAEEEDEFYQTTYGGFTEARAGPRRREGRKLKGVLKGETLEKDGGGEQRGAPVVDTGDGMGKSRGYCAALEGGTLDGVGGTRDGEALRRHPRVWLKPMYFCS